MYHSQFKHWSKHWSGEGRFFNKGDIKYLVLDLLKEKSRYGYEIIKELEDKFQGFYTPSPGSVYPTLQWFEEMGYVTSSSQDGKKIYTITDEGRKFLEERAEPAGEVRRHMKAWCNGWSDEAKGEFREAMHAFGDLGRTLGLKARKVSKEKLSKIREVISKATSEIEDILKS